MLFRSLPSRGQNVFYTLILLLSPLLNLLVNAFTYQDLRQAVQAHRHSVSALNWSIGLSGFLLASLLAVGADLAAAVGEALQFLDQSLDAGFRPGMGHVVPDRFFWALPPDEEGDPAAALGATDPASDFDNPDQPLPPGG